MEIRPDGKDGHKCKNFKAFEELDSRSGMWVEFSVDRKDRTERNERNPGSSLVNILFQLVTR